MVNEKSVRQRSPCSFRPSVDRSRPHELVSEYNPESAVLTYRYTDSGERVTVPHTWLNKPLDLHRQEAEQRAHAADQRAAVLEESPPQGIVPEAVSAIIAYHRRKASQLRVAAGASSQSDDLPAPATRALHEPELA